MPWLEAQEGDTTSELLARLSQLRSEKTKAEALDAEQQLLAETAQRFGERSLEVVGLLDAIVHERVRSGQLTDDSLSLALRATLLRSELFGANHPHLVGGLLDLGYLLHVHSDLATARSVYRWALEVSERRLGPESEEAALSLAGLGNIETDLNNDEVGEQLLRRSVSILERHHGPYHPKTTDSLFRLANYLFDRDRFIEARRLWEQALEAFRRHPNADRREQQLARCLHNIGTAHHRMGEIPEALNRLEEALRLRREGGWPQFASSATALAKVLHDSGDFAEARRLYEEAILGIEDWFGRDPFRYAEALSDLALLFEESGRTDDALRLHREVLALRLEKLGTDDAFYVGRSRARLGRLLLDLGELEEAEDHLGEALRVQASTLDPTHVDVVRTLTAFAELELAHGRLTRARDLLSKATEFANTREPDHVDEIEAIRLLAGLEIDLDDLASARQTLGTAIDAAETVFGEQSTRLVALRSEGARLDLVSGAHSDAIDSALDAERLRREHVRSTISFFAEHDALAFVEAGERPLAIALTALEQLGDRRSSTQVFQVWDSVMRSRSLVFDSVAELQRIRQDRMSPELTLLADEVSAARNRLAALLLRNSSEIRNDRGLDLTRAAIETLRHAEERLGNASAPFLQSVRRRAIESSTVRAQLPAEAALVSFVRFGGYNSTAREGAEDRYAAFVSAPNHGPIEFVSLGPAAPIDRTIREWRRLGELGLTGTQAAEQEFRQQGRVLRSLVWEPIAPIVHSADLILVVPAGRLSLINLSALPTEDGGYLVEGEQTFHHVATEKDLIRAPGAPGRGLLALGGVNFNALPSRDLGPSETASARGVELTRGWARCERSRDHYFPHLTATLSEVRQVSAAWREGIGIGGAGDDLTTAEAELVLSGISATETAFKNSAPGHRVLHLATHGFFLEADCLDPPATGRVRGDSRPQTTFKLPGLTGLALTGANLRHRVSSGDDDGMLTALEVTTLDLRGVEWAVLSACNTGVGEVHSGEGTLSLQRAFSLAGASTVIMSLWSVDDESTRAFMQDLYRLRFAERLDSATAMKQAALTRLAARRSADRSSHPVFWGAFIASGDWR